MATALSPLWPCRCPKLPVFAAIWPVPFYHAPPLSLSLFVRSNFLSMDEVPSDPATQFRRRARITLSSHSSSPSPTQHDPLALTSGDGDDRDENDAKLRHSGNSDNSSAQYRSSLSYGQAVKRAKHGISTKSTADFDPFLKVRLPL